MKAIWNGQLLTESIDTVVVNGSRNEDAAWFYPETKNKAEHIKGRIAFWKDVEVTD